MLKGNKKKLLDTIIYEPNTADLLMENAINTVTMSNGVEFEANRPIGTQ